jgi:3D (Asp-Asp-Asp) domain-containing protein
MGLIIILFTMIIFAGFLIVQINTLEKKVGNSGDTVVKLLNVFESNERLFSYMDTSIELAAKAAEKQTIESSGYKKEIFKGRIQNRACGFVAYPVIDSKKPIADCFPDYERAFKTVFIRNMQGYLLKYAPFKIDVNNMLIGIVLDDKDLNVTVSTESGMNLPIFAYIESYYRATDKTKTEKVDLYAITKDANGYSYYLALSMLSAFQREKAATLIVIEGTGTTDYKATEVELATGLHNYNYVIERDGTVYTFAPEEKYTRSSGCTKAESKTCLVTNTDIQAISIALVLYGDQAVTDAQKTALIKLMAEISIRCSEIKLDAANIFLNSEIDSSRKDIPLTTGDKASLITSAKQKKDSLLGKQPDATDTTQGYVPGAPATNPPPAVGFPGAIPTGGTGEVTAIGNVVFNFSAISAKNRNAETTAKNTANILTGMAVSPPSNIDELSCFTGIETTVYFTPSEQEYPMWYTGESSCGPPLYYCCIHEDKRGFYEDVKCQGSGVYAGKVYHTSTIGSTQSESEPVPGFVNGRTSTGKDPKPKFTVAANPNCPQFKYNTNLFIDWGADSEWTGYYQVQDTGSAFKGNCNKLDIYAGVGKASVTEALKGVKKTAKVCVLDANFQMPNPDFSGGSKFVDPITGQYNTKYAHDVTVDNFNLLFKNTKDALDLVITQCKDKSTAEKDKCIQDAMVSVSDIYKPIKLETCDALLQTSLSQIKDVTAMVGGPISPTYNTNIVGKITEHPSVSTKDKTYSGADWLFITNPAPSTTTTSTTTNNPTPSVANVKKILAIGDSMTGVGGVSSYPNQLATLLKNKGMTATIDSLHYDSCGTTIITQCLEGSTQTECQKSCLKDSSYNFGQVNIDNYDMVIIWGSINNIYQPDKVISDLKDMYAYAKAHNKIVVAMTVAPSPDSSYADNVKKVNNNFILTKPQNTDYVVNVYNDLVDPSTNKIKTDYVSSDSIHQNTAANTVIAQDIYNTVFSGAGQTGTTGTTTANNMDVNPAAAYQTYTDGQNIYIVPNTKKDKYPVMYVFAGFVTPTQDASPSFMNQKINNAIKNNMVVIIGPMGSTIESLKTQSNKFLATKSVAVDESNQVVAGFSGGGTPALYAMSKYNSKLTLLIDPTTKEADVPAKYPRPDTIIMEYYPPNWKDYPAVQAALPVAAKYIKDNGGTVDQENVRHMEFVKIFFDEYASRIISTVTGSSTTGGSTPGPQGFLGLTIDGDIISGVIKLRDSSGDMEIDVVGDAVQWLAYNDVNSELYSTDSFLKQDDTLMASVKYNGNTKRFYVDKFTDISVNAPIVAHQEMLKIAKQIGECETDTKTACTCKLETTRVVQNIKFDNDTITNVATGEKIEGDFHSTYKSLIDMSKGQTFLIQKETGVGNWLFYIPSTAPACVPTQTYRYVCTSLIGDEDLGTLKYALKI